MMAMSLQPRLVALLRVVFVSLTAPVMIVLTKIQVCTELFSWLMGIVCFHMNALSGKSQYCFVGVIWVWVGNFRHHWGLSFHVYKAAQYKYETSPP